MLPQIRRAVACVLLISVLASCGSGGDAETAGSSAGVTAIVNARVFTVSGAQPWAEAFAFDSDGVIIAVGDEDDVLDAAGPGAFVRDLDGHLVLPGFQDLHVHVPEAGLNLNLCLFEPGLTVEEYGEVAAECAADRPDADWVLGAGAPLFQFRDADRSPLAVLDEAVPDRPALILDDLGHAGWTNSAGLAAAGLTGEDTDPAGGILHRDLETGELTGLVLEDAQQVLRNAAAPDPETTYAALLVALEELAANGVTSVSDAGGYWGQDHPAAWYRAYDEGTLTVRAANALYLYPDLPLDEQLDEFDRRLDVDSDWLRFDTAKVYLDGILDLGTALLDEPYLEPPDPQNASGFRYFLRARLHAAVNRLHGSGFRINFHVIGDRATSEALDAIEAIDAPADQIALRRHRLTHVYLVADRDLARFGELGVIADLQLNPSAIDPVYHRELAAFATPRAQDLIPTRTLHEAGATVALSSDWDAGPLSPLGTISRAVIRQDQGIDVETAIAMMTINAADALGHADTTGSIEAGKFADFVVLDRDIFAIDPSDIAATQVLATWVGGTQTYG